MGDVKTSSRQKIDDGEALKAAVSKLSPVDDFKNLGKVPCARSSLLTGMATAAGVIGVTAIAGRGLRKSLNWGVGSFCFVSIASWEICRRQRKAEHNRMKMMVETFPNRAAAAAADRKRSESSEPPISRISPSVTS
ncbi:hypothetical protein A4X09_0g5278 [Tilletia walkeri]|uniref:Cytochrome c oxidase assembly protein COX20, mitochondrial n=1 Tax=Tilletia walkeri TaxID=117179 RepID=A0A8X7T368_9BASI|nr:hypothetical protein A4X09_0g5278 [Tilletia walkeri]